MRRETHLVVGALAVVPLAGDRSLEAAAGIVVLGMMGAAVPDFLDLRSDIRRVLRHRGVSHSLLAGGLAVALVSAILGALSSIDDVTFRVDASLVAPLTIAFAIGLLSHLALDACTPGGIRPLLPLLDLRIWLLPRVLRVRTGGSIDVLIGRLAGLALTVAVVARIVQEF